MCDLSRCYVHFFFYSRKSLAEFCLITLPQVIHVSINRIGCCPTVKNRSIQQWTRITLYIPVTLLLLVRYCECFIIEIIVGSKSRYEVNMPFSLSLLAYYYVVLWKLAHLFIVFFWAGGVMYYLHELIILCENTTVDLKTSQSDRYHPISCFNLSCASQFMKNFNYFILPWLYS